jgi:hypothetical protein
LLSLTALLLYQALPALEALAAEAIQQTKMHYKLAWMRFAEDRCMLPEMLQMQLTITLSSNLRGSVTLTLVLLFDTQPGRL